MAPKTTKGKGKGSKHTTATAKSSTGPWSVQRILNGSSPIATKDVHAFLVPAISGWSTDYTEAEKRTIIDSLPPRFRRYDTDATGALVCPITLDFVLDDPFLKSAVSKFKRAVADGFYEQGWQNRARRAMQERQEGRFDEYLQEQVEAAFGEVEGEEEEVVEEEEGDGSDGEWGARKGGRKH